MPLLPTTLLDNPYIRLMRLERPVGSLLLLWPTLAALWMAAEGLPEWHLIVIFTVGTLVMRSAGCVINDYADRHIDGDVERTRNRPLVTGAVTPQQALLLFAGLVALAGLLVLFLSWTTLLVAAGGLLIAALYPFTKRWTHLPQTVLGAAFSWGILLAWVETTGAISQEAGLFFAASMVWIVAYDTMYAMVDREDDLRIGVKSTAVLFGELDRLMIALLQTIVVVALLLLGQRLAYHSFYFIGVCACAGLFIYQQYLIRKRQPEGCFKAFTNNTWAGFALFCGTVAELTWQALGS
ncbi:MAG: 4-hydroxybenzoate octaprenyltransferase [Pseudomonadales bacterium]